MRFSYEEADNYGNNGASSFFQLKNDKETAKVRIMYTGMKDVQGLSVHEIELNGKKRYVNCIREYDEPIDKCPLCKANYKIIAKIFVPLFNEETGEVQVWERGKKFLGKLSSLCSRYDNLVSRVFEIERNGKPKDTATTYEIYPIGDADSTTLDDLPEPVDIMKGIVLDKSADDMSYFLKYHEFPDTTDAGEDVPFEEEPRRRDEAPRRRTPANRGDAF